jgi:hypothetical protein
MRDLQFSAFILIATVTVPAMTAPVHKPSNSPVIIAIMTTILNAVPFLQE